MHCVWEKLRMAFTVSAEIDYAPTGNMHDISDAACSHRLAHEIGISVLIPLALSYR